MIFSKKKRMRTLNISENIGIIILTLIVSAVFTAVGIVLFLQYFTCNVNLDCYRRRCDNVTSIVIFELIKRLIIVYNNSLSTWPGNGFHSLIMSINILKLIIEGRTLNPTQFPFQYQKMHWWREENENI